MLSITRTGQPRRMLSGSELSDPICLRGVIRPSVYDGGIELTNLFERCRREVTRKVMSEDHGRVERVRKLMAGVRPPFARSLAGSRHHRGDKDQQLRGQTVAHKRRSEPTERLRDQDHLSPVADGGNHRLGVLLEPRRIVVARQIYRHDVVARRLEERHNEMPVPRVRSCAVNQNIRSHVHEDE